MAEPQRLQETMRVVEYTAGMQRMLLQSLREAESQRVTLGTIGTVAEQLHEQAMSEIEARVKRTSSRRARGCH